MNWIPAAKVVYIVISTALSAHHSLDSACSVGSGRVFKVSSSPPNYTYAIGCAGTCPTPPDDVSVEEILCVKVPEKTTKKEVVEVVPEHYEEGRPASRKKNGGRDAKR